MDFRTLTPADAAAYWRLREQALLTEPAAFGRDVEEHRATTIADAESMLRNMPAAGFVMGAFEGEALVGIATFMRETGRKEKHKGHIYGVYLDAEHRQGGNGRRLLTALLTKAREDATLEQILLSVRTGNGAAGRLYRSLGFTIFGIEPHALKLGSEYIDEEQMILWLHPPSSTAGQPQ